MKKVLSLLVMTLALTGCVSKEQVMVGLLAKAHATDTKKPNVNFIKTDTQELFEDFYHAKDSNTRQIKKYQKVGTITSINGVVNSIEQKYIFLKVENNERSTCGIRADTSEIEKNLTVGDNVTLWLSIKPDSIDLNEIKNTCILTIKPTVVQINKK